MIANERAFPFTLRRECDYHVDRLRALQEFCTRGLADGNRDELPYALRFSSQVDLDTPDSRSVLISWDHGAWRYLVVHSAGATDRHIPTGHVALTLGPGVIRVTVNRFHGVAADEAEVSVCRDAWISGQYAKAEALARTICPHTWPVLLAACDVDRLGTAT